MPEEEKKEKTPEPKTWWKRWEVIGGVGLVILNAAANPLVATINPYVYLGATTLLGILTAVGLIKGKAAGNLALTKENYKIGATK
jgi:hypothetical protein